MCPPVHKVPKRTTDINRCHWGGGEFHEWIWSGPAREITTYFVPVKQPTKADGQIIMKGEEARTIDCDGLWGRSLRMNRGRENRQRVGPTTGEIKLTGKSLTRRLLSLTMIMIRWFWMLPRKSFILRLNPPCCRRRVVCTRTRTSYTQRSVCSEHTLRKYFGKRSLPCKAYDDILRCVAGRWRYPEG